MKLAIVTPWFGRDLKGGAEQHAWQIATRLAGRGHQVEVLTTCCRSHQDDWEVNHLPAGGTLEPEGFEVLRFPVVARDRVNFDRVCSYLLSLNPQSLKPGVSPVSAEDSKTFVSELIKSPRLAAYLKEQEENYSAFVFLPYLYGPVLEGIAAVPDRAVLLPCLHNEAYAYLPEVADAFYDVRKVLFLSDGEMELALRLFGPGIWSKCVMVGGGVEGSPPIDDSSIAAKEKSSDRYLLYLGRKDPGKNVPLLLNAFNRFHRVRPNSTLKLFLAGNGRAETNGHPTVKDFGLVSDVEKERLLRGCLALVQPSQNESFSRVMMEAWFHGKPVAAHARCLATAVAVERARGGWTADSEEEWAALFVTLDRLSSEELQSLGKGGRQYAHNVADWDSVMERYETALSSGDSLNGTAGMLTSGRRDLRIDQFLPNLSYGDAISNHALLIRDHLQKSGYKSEIFVRFIDPRVAHECKLFSPEKLDDADAVIYHHSIGTEITPHVVEFAGPKSLIYHNITPAEFFDVYRPEFAAILRRGRQELRHLAPHFPISFGVSAFNAAELEHWGFDHPGILSLTVNTNQWEFPPDSDLMRQLQDGRTNLLFVGRIAPNKKQDELVRALHNYHRLDPAARLILVGSEETADPYAKHVRQLILELNLSDSVLMMGSISGAQLAACYRTAHLFLSMSEHEGFCVPLIEAMWFDVPILAFASSAIPETLADAGLLFTTKEEPGELAALISLMIHDKELRRTIISKQRKRRENYRSDETVPCISKLVEKLVRATSAS